jgi:hypothetical protein
MPWVQHREGLERGAYEYKILEEDMTSLKVSRLNSEAVGNDSQGPLEPQTQSERYDTL